MESFSYFSFTDFTKRSPLNVRFPGTRSGFSQVRILPISRIRAAVFSEGGAVWFSAGLGLCLLVGALTYAVLMKKKKVKEG